MANCGCNDPYTNICRQDIPYPQTSHESVPSLIDNLVNALYGDVTKYVEGGRVLWNIPCDPSQSPAEVPSIPRNEGEGLLCYIMRVFQLTVGQYSPFQFWAFTGNGSAQTFSLPPSTNTLASSYLVYINGVVQSPSPSVYTISNTTPVNLVFQTAPASGAAITVVNLGYTPPSVIDVTQSAATPTGSAQTQTVGAWLQQILLALSTPSGGVPQGGLRWATIGNGIQTTLPLTGAVSSNPTAYLVAINGVVQDPADYNINTSAMPYSLVLSSPIPNGSELVVVSINSPIAGWFTGAGQPNGVLAAPVGSIYINTTGGVNNTFWIKEVGSGNTGWGTVSSNLGPQGATGPLGATGFQGSTGAQGATGVSGAVPTGGTRWVLNGNGILTTLSLPGSISINPTAYLVAIDGVVQDPDDYTINTGTNPYSIVMSQPIPSGSEMVVVSINSPLAGWFVGNGNPNGIVTAPIGSIYVNKDGGGGNTFWVKETGTGNVGWVPQNNSLGSGSGVPAGGLRWAFSGNGSTAIYTLPGALATASTASIVAIDGVFQDPNDYTIDSSSFPLKIDLSFNVPNGSLLVIVSVNSGISAYTGTGNPNGIVTAPIGSLYSNLSGGANQTLWIKESGNNTNTGWIAK